MAAADIVGTRRRVAVLLGSGSSCRRVLDALLPLLEGQSGIELEGVLLEESELESAAALPFVREVCRLTLSIREFRPGDARRQSARRMREAEQLLGEVANRIGAAHSIRSVRGPALRLLRETLQASDITLFEPVRASAMQVLEGESRAVSARRRIAVVVDDAKRAALTIRAAMELAQQRDDRIAVLLTPAAAQNIERVERAMAGALPLGRRIVDRLQDDSIHAVIRAAKRVGAGALVLPASDALLDVENLRTLQQELSCPVVVVRQTD